MLNIPFRPMGNPSWAGGGLPPSISTHPTEAKIEVSLLPQGEATTTARATEEGRDSPGD